MKSVQRGKSPASIALKRSRPWLSRSLATRASASASVRFCDPLLGAEMEFDPDALVRRVDHRKGVAAEEVHIPEALRDAAVGHDDCDLVQRFGQQGPEIPVIVGAAHPGARVALDRVVEIGKAQRVAEKEHRRIVADDVPVALLSVELQRGAADVALGVGGAALASDGGEAREHRRLFADFGKDLRLRKAGDVLRHRKGAVGAPALGMHAALGDHLAVEMRQLLEQPDVLQQCRTAGTGGQDVGVVGDRRAGFVGENPLRGHGLVSPRWKGEFRVKERSSLSSARSALSQIDDSDRRDIWFLSEWIWLRPLFGCGARLHTHSSQCAPLHPEPAVQRAGKDRTH